MFPYDRDTAWHALPAAETSRRLHSAEEGLEKEEAARRLVEFGPNALKEQKQRSLTRIVLDQFKSVMILILIAAAVISAFAEGVVDAVIVLAIVAVNAMIGTVQEVKARKSLDALKDLSAPAAKVIRNGVHLCVPAKDLVPGDMVVLEAGDRVPADLRLLRSMSLRVEESALTGESVPVEKDASALLPEDCALGDRLNMAASASIVVYGRGLGVVTATGMDTQVGRIAGMLQTAEEKPTPLQKKLDRTGRTLGFAAVAICAVLFAVGILYGRGLLEMFMIAVTLAVAAIPEGLPAVAAIVLALGVQRMVKRNAIIRTLPSVETLGTTTVICSDKTGTLTQNRMTVTRIWTEDGMKNVGELDPTMREIKLVKAAVLCNDAREQEGRLSGDPTETALVRLGEVSGLSKKVLEKEHPRVYELPFDSERKLMTTVHAEDGYTAYTKGAVDELLRRCTHRWTPDGIRPMQDGDIARIQSVNEQMAGEALRVLGYAARALEQAPDGREDIETGLAFIGLSGMIDPPRPEAVEAVRKCREAGIRTVMITGDHVATAVAIARAMDILHEGDAALTGQELSRMDDAAFGEIAENVSVYARVSPEHKVRIVDEWRRRGHIVAMTGDGVNDAPALKKADIGAAMGLVGTDVAKEAADMVLTDDNFATVVAAVEEGRRISDNIEKSIQFLISANVGEILALFLPILLNLGTPLLPLHILWVNLVTDSLPALALGVDPAEPGIMRRPPASSYSLFSGGMLWRVAYQGMIIGLITLAAYLAGLRDGVPVARTMAFSTLALSQLVHAFNVRSKKRSAFSSGRRNGWLFAATGVSVLLMAAVLFIPGLSQIFSIATLLPHHILITAGLVLAPLAVVELFKLLRVNTAGRERRK